MSKKTTDQKIDILTDNISLLSEKMDKGFKVLDKKIDSLDKKIDSRVDTLALAVAKGFDEVHSEFRVINKKIDILDSKMTGMSGRVEVLEDQMRMVRTKLDLR